MRQTLSAAALLVSTLALAACGSSDVDTEFKDTETGEKTQLSADMDGDGVALPADLPAYAAPYPGAKIVMVMSRPGEKGGGLASMTVKAEPQSVIDHFRKQGEAAGMKMLTELSTGTTRVIAMGTDADGGSGMQITVSPSDENEGEQLVSVTYSMPKS